jgi:predicted nucleic acid-binding protein
MSDRVFLDTCIFIHAVDDRSNPKGAVAERLIARGLEMHNAVVSYQVVQEFLNVSLTKFARPLPMEHAARYMATVFRGLDMIHSSLGLFSAAMEIRNHHRLSWADSLIVGAAAASNCTKLYSEDLQNGAVIAGVKVENPFRNVPGRRTLPFAVPDITPQFSD